MEKKEKQWEGWLCVKANKYHNKETIYINHKQS